MRFSSLLAVAVLATPGSAGDEAFRLNTALQTPDWFSLSGETRVRYETLDGQFRAGSEGSDQLLLFRSLLLAEADTGPITFGLELQDSRTYLGDEGTPLGSSISNPLDILQLYASFDDVPSVFGSEAEANLRVGRLTVSIGSKRQIERVDFANVIKSYSGAHYTATAQDGSELHGLYVVPTARFPNTRPDIDDNMLSGDEEQWGRRIYALHYRKADAFPAIADDIWGELFVYGLEEEDTDDFQTPDRSYLAPGFRVYRKPQKGEWDIDLEAAYRFGTRYATSNPVDTQSLDVSASVAFLALGKTFETPWQPRLAFEWYYASGDDDPTDLNFDQHERLFGSRRSDLNNTSIHGPLTPANLNAPGFRIEAKPNARWDGRFYYHAAYLASETDSWVIARRRDATGQSGDFIGHTLDARARYWVVPDSLRFEIGGSALIYGEFAEDVPNGPNGDGTLFGYTMLTFTF